MSLTAKALFFHKSSSSQAAFLLKHPSKQGIMEAVLLLIRSLFKRFYLVGPLVGTLLLSSCGEKEQGKIAKPLPQAVAPTLQPHPTQPATVAPPAAPVPVAQAQSVPEPQKQDPVPGIIAAAEKAYESGQANYKAGHLAAAKQDFNHAVDILMQGPVDVRADSRLELEFDKITREISKLETGAFKAGDGFTEQQSEPAPIDEANQVTFPVDQGIKAKAEADLKTTQSDLPLMINDYVAGYINYFSNAGRGVFERSVIRSGRYREMIQRIFKQEGVPQDLIYLAQAESGFHPLALSRARARGMWQFMASRGVGYGLRRSWWVDDRQDPEKSTLAAAKHLKDLYNQFGDWYLAMAAYNSGPGNVQQAVRRTGYADFWELYRRDVLPKETKNYVPIILAMTIMSKNPAQYGLDTLQAEPSEQYDVVRVDYPVDLRLAAECVDSPVEDLVDLNPSLVRRTTPKDQSFDLHLPLGTREKYQTAIAAIPKDKRVAWRYHKVQPGDTLAGIAKKYRTTERSIAQANGLTDNELKADTRVVIPVSAAASDAANIRYSKYPSRYRVHTGDTVLTVSEDFGVPPERLRRWNRLKGNELRRGRLLTVYKPLGPGEPDKAPPRRRTKRSVHTATTAKPQSPANASSKQAISARVP
jgi:membrane-bound lytic murein transglycosylase D